MEDLFPSSLDALNRLVEALISRDRVYLIQEETIMDLLPHDLLHQLRSSRSDLPTAIEKLVAIAFHPGSVELRRAIWKYTQGKSDIECLRIDWKPYEEFCGGSGKDFQAFARKAFLL